ncbi:hypothetical protein KKG22_03555 [Patescibacteria group bacterium]|nr:hypothetical protein [Patescibacteria group bacterium]MBU1721226.1 hypothetical protein [Patescibacteria group bacterium]MBU1901066.1 hypothetical protein [Patescibacteria group bacterium]
MGPSRQLGTLPTEQPVRFYKFIALTFLLITVVLLGIIIFMSSKRAVVTIFTKKTPVDLRTDFTLVLDEEELHGVGYMVTSTEIVLNDVFFPTGTKEEPGQATGYVTLHNTSAAAQPLVATTRLLSGDNVLFRLKSGVTVPANGTVDNVEVYSDTEGAANDIGPSTFVIPGLNPTRQKDVYATSDSSMKGGVRTLGVLSQKDIDAATETMKNTFRVKSEEQFSQSVGRGMAGIYDVGDITIEADTEPGKEVSEFHVKGTALVMGIFYNEEQMGEWSKDQLMKRAIDGGEMVHPADTTPTVTFDSYNELTKEVVLHVFYDGTVSLNPESDQIEKAMFFGKTKDEVRRYLLSLDHVHKVEVEFHPAWMRSVPHINEHLTVFVQEVE